MKPARLNSRKTPYNGQLYDSAAEAHRAATLDLLVKAGRIVRWERGSRQLVFDGGVGRKVFYTPDFLVWRGDRQAHAEEVKGVARDWRTKRLILPRDLRIRLILWEVKYPDLPVIVVDRDGSVIWRLNSKRDLR